MFGSRLIGAARHISKALAYGLTGALAVLIVIAVTALNNRPDLKAWHTAKLDAEFSRDSRIDSFDAYLLLEDRLFGELDREVYERVEPQDRRAINRFSRGSGTDPGGWPTNWNRSYEWPSDNPPFGALLLHGLSDSPYSLRSVAESLHEAGGWVIGLRIPGHGTAPSGLLNIEWEDWAAAVRLAMVHLARELPGRPVYIVGYSNGGALATQYALSALDDPGLPRPDGLVLISAEIGISKLAALAAWQERLGHVLGLEKLAWNVLQPEYDPWKYNSFTLNAAKQAHRLTGAIQSRMDTLEESGQLAEMPPVIAFQSVVDATVTAPALVDSLFRRLPARPVGGSGPASPPHELVLFDFNRYSQIEPLIDDDPSIWIEPMRSDPDLPFAVTLLTNQAAADQAVVAYTRRPGGGPVEICRTGMLWPDNVYSLSHVALPIPPDDPIYGRARPADVGRIFLGDVALRGEYGVLSVPPAAILRLRWNPFHSYLLARIRSFVTAQGRSGFECLGG